MLAAGRSGIGPVTLFDTNGLATRIAGEVRGNFDPAEHIPLKNCAAWTGISICTGSRWRSVRPIRAPRDPEDPYRCGVIVGSGIGGLATIEAGVMTIPQKGPRAIHPLTIPKAVINLAPGMLSISMGSKGRISEW